ncbi:MAG: hypothetical protein AB8B99_14120 [Phormidesmis sp.]
MTLFRNITPELTMICLMMMAGYAQVAKAQVSVQTENSRIETGEHGVLIETGDRRLGRPPLNPSHPLIRNAHRAYPTAPAVGIPESHTDYSVSNQCAGSHVSTSQRVSTQQSHGTVTQHQTQTTATCQ